MSTVTCAVDGGARTYYGERACLSDGGFDSCRERSACANTTGVCRDARRLLDDTEGCTEISYRAVATFRTSELCDDAADAGFDGFDNDCDGYTDELLNDEAQLACGRGICELRDPDAGTLKAYRTCQNPVCPVALLSTAYGADGYAPVDTCDGVDRDCSGQPDVGPVSVLAERGVAVAGVSMGGSVPHRVAVATETDAGYTVSMLELDAAGDEQLRTLLTPSARSSVSDLRVAAASSNVAIASWLEGNSIFFRGSLGAALIDLREIASLSPISKHSLAALNTSVVVTADLSNMTTPTSAIRTFSLLAGSTFSWDPTLDLPNAVYGLHAARMVGRGTQKVGVGVNVKAESDPDLFVEVDFDAPGIIGSFYPALDGGFSAPAIDGGAALTSEFDLALAPGGYVAGFTLLNGPGILLFNDTSGVLRSVAPPLGTVLDFAVAAGPVDGGVSAAMACRGDLGLTLNSVGSRIALDAGVTGRPALLWLDGTPYVLLLAPERRADGSSMVTRRLVCAPARPL